MNAEQQVALFSLSDDDKPGSEIIARELIVQRWKIIASRGTKLYLEANGVPLNCVTDVSELAETGPVLDHMVVTLCPAIHGGLLAGAKQQEEIASLGWPVIDLLWSSLYPLKATIDDPNSTPEKVNANTDMGGVALIRSACKGGRIVITSSDQWKLVMPQIKGGKVDRLTRLQLRVQAEKLVSQYAHDAADYWIQQYVREAFQAPTR